MAWERSGVPGGGTTRTSWFDRDLPAMWRVLENQQSDDHWRLVAGWRKASELTATHLRRLEHYRTNLADVWPPDRNAAAAAYVARLDFLIQNVRTTHEVAAANYSTVAATVGALAAARQDLKPLHDEYMAKARAIKEHADLAAFNAAAEAPTVIGAAPAAAQDLERLNNRARAIMYTLSHTLVEAEAAIRQPPAYPSRSSDAPINPDVYGRTGITPLERPGSTGSADPLGTNDGVGPQGQHGPDISNRSLPHTLVPAGNQGDSGHWPTAPPALDPKLDTRHPSKHTSGVAPGSNNWRAPRVLSVDGIIGPIPSTKQSPTPAPAARVNPVGGVIGNLHTGGNLGARNGPQPAFGAFGGTPRDQQRRAILRQDGETVWAVPEGVEPVIMPSQHSGDFDPGPTIGLDR